MDTKTHSVVLDRKHWEGNPKYFFQIMSPRVSKYAQRADDACIQTQIDIYGRDNVGIYQSGLSSAASFAAVFYAESSPDRLTALAYLNEIISFYEEFEEEIANVTGATVDGPVRRDPKFDKAQWQENFKQALSKAAKTMSSLDDDLGPKAINTFRDLSGTPNLSSRMPEYKSLDEYFSDRVIDIALPSLAACAEFGAALHVTDNQKKSVEALFRPLKIHSACVWDYYMYDKEAKAVASHGQGLNMVNSIALLGRLKGLSVDEAKAWLKQKCLECEAEYLELKKAYLAKNPLESLPAELRQYLDCQESIATGFAIWGATTYRFHEPFQVGYEKYYEKRLREGAVWYDGVAESEQLLPGGFEVGSAH